MTERLTFRGLTRTAAALLFVLLGVAPAAGQDSRATPFVGCWSPAGGSGPELCIEATDEGLHMVRIAEGRETGRELLVLGAVRELERDGCAATERARFSSDGQRVLVRTEYACEGGVERVESGILALPARSGRAGGPDHEQLLDVRAVSMDGESVAWVQRYRLTREADTDPSRAMRVEVARRAAAAELQPADVIDAAELVDGEALRAWVAESGSSFDLDASTLVALADAGVDPDVLDVMIAVSHPEYFALAVDGSVAEAEFTDQGGGFARSGWAGSGWGFSPWGWGGVGAFGWGPAFGWDPFFSPFGFSRLGWSSRWGAFGRPAWGGWGGGWGGGIVVVPGGGGSVDSGSRGRVVNGRGYTRGRGSTTTGRSYPSGGSSAAPSRGSSGGAATRGSSTRGRSTGRTAKPRRGGGGGGLF